MLYLVTALTLLGHRLHDHVTTRYRRVVTDRDSEAGGITIEQVIWAGLVIGFVALVGGAIKTYLDAQVGKIQ